MALSDCAKCWDTPCECGHEYRNYSQTRMVAFIHAVMSTKNLEDRQEILEKLQILNRK